MRGLLDRRAGPQRRGGGALPPFTALYLDGTGDYASVADAAALTPAGAEWSIGGWVWTTTDAVRMLASKGNYSVSMSMFLEAGYAATADQMSAWHTIVAGDVGSSFTQCPRYSVPQSARWWYVACSFNGAEAVVGAGVGPQNRVKMWIGASPIWTRFTAAVYSTAVIDDTDSLYFGAFKNAGVVGAYPAQYQHDWCMWSRALAQADVEAHIAGAPSQTGLIRRWFHQRHKVFDDGAAYPPIAVADAAYVAMPGALPRSVRKVHLIGDSITQGTDPDWGAGPLYRGGWRRYAFDLALLRGVSQRSVSVGDRMTEEGHPCMHDGWAGAQWSQAEIIAACQGSGALTPDAVLISLGTNDIAGAGQPASVLETRFDARMEDLYTTGGLSTATPVGVWPIGELLAGGFNTIRDEFHAWLIATGIPAQRALGRNVVWVPHTYVAGDNAGSDTNVHLSDAGNQHLAATLDAWLAANGC